MKRLALALLLVLAGCVRIYVDQRGARRCRNDVKVEQALRSEAQPLLGAENRGEGPVGSGDTSQSQQKE